MTRFVPERPSEFYMQSRGVPVEEILRQREYNNSFAEVIEGERLMKSRAKITKMKQRFETKAIDFTKVRWDARRNKFVPLEPAVVVAKTAPKIMAADVATGLQKITKANAEAIAKLNGVWKPEYEKLRGTGRIVMTVGNVLKGLVKRGGSVKWN